jgi:hypothetical protein
MQRKLLGIINMDFDAAGQLLIIYSAFVKYLRKNGNTMKQCISSLYTSVRREVLYNILIEFGIPMKLVRLIKMCLNETYSTVRVGKSLSDVFPIRCGLKEVYVVLSLLFNFALEYAIRRVQVNQDGFKLNGTHHLLVYASDVNRLGRSIHTIKENAEVLIAANKKIGLEGNADKTKFMVISGDQNGG